MGKLMSIGRIGNIELAYRNGAWYYGQKGGTIVKTNNVLVIHSLFLSEGNPIPYDLLSSLQTVGSLESEWVKMSTTYAL